MRLRSMHLAVKPERCRCAASPHDELPSRVKERRRLECEHRRLERSSAALNADKMDECSAFAPWPRVHSRRCYYY